MMTRDSAGFITSALSQRIPLPQTIEEVEALACRREIQLLTDDAEILTSEVHDPYAQTTGA